RLGKETDMSTHSYSRCWLHLIWETLRREPMLDRRAAAKASENLYKYCEEKSIYMKINYFNADHTHSLIDLPTNLTIEQVIHLLKGSSSHWINQNRLLRGRFAWDAATEPFRFRIRTLIACRGILRVKANIIVREALKMNISSLLSATVWS